MGTIWIKELTGGLDVRRLPETTPGGVLMKASDGHITRGGEFEKRAAFVSAYTLPANTVGFAHTNSGLVVFGHVASPAMPSGVTYQRLQHPDTVTALTDVISYDLFDKKIYAVGLFADGSIHHFYDGTRVADWFDGRARASFRVVGGTGSSQLTDLKVNGVTIIGATVTWATSNENTAALIAAEITSDTSSPEYTATSVGDTVNIVASTAGAAPNGFGVAFTVASGLLLTPATGLVMAGGSSSAGTFLPGPFVRTIKSKMYAVSDGLLHYSGISAPTSWQTSAIGAGFDNLAEQNSGSELLTSIARYQNLLAVFSAGVVQIWSVDPDPQLNVQVQVLDNTGTECANSVTQFGDSDVFYLDESGLRSLRARDSSNAAATNDIGTPVDDLITAKLATLTPSERRRVYGLINPVDKRFWLVFPDEIFVFSFYQNAKVSAWTTYSLTTKPDETDATGFSCDAAVVFNRRPYIRSGDMIYVYGGLSGALTYDETEPEAWFPYLDANSPTEAKSWTGIDVAVTGQWEVSAAPDVENQDRSEVIARPYYTTFNSQRVPYEHSSSHLALRFKATGGGQAKLSAAVIHFEGGEGEN
jgi:hypothetical protein